MEQSTVNQRLNLIVDTFENGVKAAFARKAGISPQGAQEILAGRKGDPSFKVLVKILENCPALDANWLVLGHGEMFKHSISDRSALPTTSAEFIAEYIEHRDGRSEIPDILRSSYDLAQWITKLLGDDSQSAERSILLGLHLDYDELIEKRRQEIIKDEGGNERLAQTADNTAIKIEILALQRAIAALYTELHAHEELLKVFNEEGNFLAAAKADIVKREKAERASLSKSEDYQYLNNQWLRLLEERERIRQTIGFLNQQIVEKQANYIGIINKVLGIELVEPEVDKGINS